MFDLEKMFEKAFGKFDIDNIWRKIVVFVNKKIPEEIMRILYYLSFKREWAIFYNSVVASHEYSGDEFVRSSRTISGLISAYPKSIFVIGISITIIVNWYGSLRELWTELKKLVSGVDIKGSLIAICNMFGERMTFFKKSSEYSVDVQAKMIGFFVILLIIALVLYFLKKTRKHSASVRSSLHNMLDRYRDRISRVQKKIDKLSKTQTSNMYEIEFDDRSRAGILRFVNELCEDVRVFFTEVTKCEDVRCAIRLLDFDENGEQVYVTFGRSEGFEARAFKFGDEYRLKRGSGISKAFSSRRINGKGVWHIRDTDLASRKFADISPIFVKLQNDLDFPDDVKNFIVAPINGYDHHSRKDTIGYLYISSNKRGSPFKARQFDFLKAVADSLGASIGEAFKYYKLKSFI